MSTFKEAKDDLDIAQDILEFNLEQEWTEEDELCDFCCNRTRLDGFYYFEVKKVIEFPKNKWKYRALNNIEKMRKKL